MKYVITPKNGEEILAYEPPLILSDLFWAEERLMTNLLLLAEEREIKRGQHQVFGVAPHPYLSNRLDVENLVAMDLPVWHHICAQLRGT